MVAVWASGQQHYVVRGTHAHMIREISSPVGKTQILHVLSDAFRAVGVQVGISNRHSGFEIRRSRIGDISGIPDNKLKGQLGVFVQQAVEAIASLPPHR